MKGLRFFAIFAMLSLTTVLMIGNAHGQISQQEAIYNVQQHVEAGVILDIYSPDEQITNVVVGTHFHEMTLKEKYDFANLLSLAYPWEIIKVTDAYTGQQVFNVLGGPAR